MRETILKEKSNNQYVNSVPDIIWFKDFQSDADISIIIITPI